MGKIGLVLEGGGMRGVYTMAALDKFIEEGIEFPYVIGVSAGSSNGSNYLSKQQGRTARIAFTYGKDKRYISWGRFLKTGSVFGMDFIFETIPRELDPFDFETFHGSESQYTLGAFDIEAGEMVYYGKEHLVDDLSPMIASCSLPVVGNIVHYGGRKLLDGGINHAIPLKKALEDGCEKVVIILTRDMGYVKPRESFRLIYKTYYRNYPKLIDALDHRHDLYNETMGKIKELKKAGRAFVIAPENPLPCSRYETNESVLKSCYEIGLKDTERLLKDLKAFLKD